MGFRKSALIVAAGLSCIATTDSQAADWWPAKVYDQGKGGAEVEYVPLPKAEKQWNLCVLFPHVKDSIWVAAAYGVVEEAKRQGVKMTLFQAGGYDSLPKQISQFDDCVAAKADVIITGAISEAGMAKKFQEGLDKSIPQVALINPVANAPVTAKVSVDYPTMGGLAAQYVLDNLQGKPAQVATFPGPQGAGWPEAFLKGFEEKLNGTPAKIVDTKWGDTGVAVQLRLIEDSLQTYPDVSVIWANPPAIEAAVSAVNDIGKRGKIDLIAENENQAMLNFLRTGDVKGFATLAPVLEARIAVDTAVRILEGKPYVKSPMIVPTMVTKSNIDKVNLDNIFSPVDWKPVYSVN
ncbi:TMAO reductase system periplasmic protein TorT [Bradyrhizobium sp. BR13661]|jgi:protein TorT|uniref:TMAO reductase system periplasmic protein TorT n=1 Tax=Bradyrhizobium sp. BR13661 TaxID=2940622 RepID=UPI0024760236|nr:TMAO reductase system periplasmic protein TorT [Bradyrhizobium sp. BR13661]MDH6261778.1 protein TorT [Bradyrhizobium sp. BR13661]